MRSKVGITCLAIILAMVTIASFAHAQTAGPARLQKSFAARCEELRYDCETIFTLENKEIKAIDAVCKYPPAGWKGEPLYAAMVISYKCDVENEGETVACKGSTGLSPANQKTFSIEEFQDAETRCTRLCKPCPQGWK